MMAVRVWWRIRASCILSERKGLICQPVKEVWERGLWSVAWRRRDDRELVCRAEASLTWRHVRLLGGEYLFAIADPGRG